MKSFLAKEITDEFAAPVRKAVANNNNNNNNRDLF